MQAQRGGGRSGPDRSYREEHLFELKLAYEAWQFTLGQVEKVDGPIALQLGADEVRPGRAAVAAQATPETARHEDQWMASRGILASELLSEATRCARDQNP